MRHIALVAAFSLCRPTREVGLVSFRRPSPFFLIFSQFLRFFSPSLSFVLPSCSIFPHLSPFAFSR